MTEQEAIEEIRDEMCCDYSITGCDYCDISSCSNKDAFIMARESLKYQSEYKDIVDCFIQRVEIKDGKPLKGYRILTNEDAIKYDELREKQIPKKPIIKGYRGMEIDDSRSCPCCNRELQYGENYCVNCGQKLDWSEEE